MKTRLIKRMLGATLAMALILAPSMGAFAKTTTTTAVSGNRATAAPAAAAQEATVAAPAYKSTSSVAGVKSTVSGVYMLNKGIGAAILTPAGNIAVAPGARPYVKAIDMDVKKSNLAYKCMTDHAAALGATVVGTINLEIGQMLAGKYSLLGADVTVSAAFSVPKVAQGKTVAVLRVQEGGVVTLLQDTDPNPAVVAFNTTGGAAAYAIIAY